MPTARPDLDTLVAELQSIPILRGVDEASVTQLAQNAIRRTFAPGSIIFLEGDTAPAVYYIRRGWVKAVKSAPDGREQILQFLGPGEVFHGMDQRGHLNQYLRFSE
jgi:CRP-like cAMP-binding protein